MYARTENGIVTDTLRVDPFTIFPSAYASQFIDAPEGVQRGWLFDGANYVAPPIAAPVVPQSISPRQLRQALTRAGLRAGVEAAVLAGDQDTKDWYEFATAFERNHPRVAAMAAALGVSEQSLDDLWILAETL